MEPEIFKKFLRFFNTGRIKKKQKLILIASFVIIAIFLWFLNNLGEEHITTIRYPVKYSNFPADKVLISELPPEFKLRVRAGGFKILQFNFSSSLYSLRFDYQSFRSTKVPNDYNDITYILTEAARNNMDSQLDEMEILSISPDSLFFHFTVEKSKKVEVRPEIKYDLEKQFMLIGNIVCDPDSVIIEGPAVYLDTMSYVKTQFFKIKKLNKTISKNLQIETPHDNINILTKRVNVSFNVEKFTENELNIPIEAVNLPDNMFIRTFPGSVKVKYHVVISEYDKYESEHFRAIVDYNTISNNLGNKLKVKIEKIPENIFIVGFSPANVEYIIEK